MVGSLTAHRFQRPELAGSRAELRQPFLEVAGYRYDDEFKFRMRVRMALHCLDILLPRKNSFDEFEPDGFEEALQDFKAAVEGRENPQGYA